MVIGNDSYQKVEKLRNARADARAMAKALETVGFKVTLRTDANEKTMREAVRGFKSRLIGGDIAVFFFSGHGVQLGSSNYLLPVDINNENEDQVKDDSLPLQRVLDDLQEQKTKFSLAIIDACRDNPFRGKGRAIGGRGLAATTAATGQMVIYSAGAGQQALDRLDNADTNPNSVFTRVFLKEMERPGISVDRMLRSVRDEVVRLAKSVGSEQVPALYDQAIGDFYFHTGEGIVMPAAPQSTVPIDTGAVELTFWESIKNSTDVADFESYLKRFPNGQFVELAQRRAQKQPAKADQLLLGKWIGDSGEFYVEPTESGLRVAGFSRLTSKDVVIDYTTWGNAFVAQNVPIQFMANSASGSLKGTWKRDGFKAEVCNIAAEEGTFTGEMSPSYDRITLRFISKRYRVLISRQLLWQDECREISVAGADMQELVLSRSAQDLPKAR